MKADTMTAILRSGWAFLFMVIFLAGCGKAGLLMPPTVEIKNFAAIAGKYYNTLVVNKKNKSDVTLAVNKKGTDDTLVINKNGSYQIQRKNKTIAGKINLTDGVVEGVRKDGSTFLVTAYECEGVRILETYSYIEKKGEDPYDEYRGYYQPDSQIPQHCYLALIRARKTGMIMGAIGGGLGAASQIRIGR